LILAAEAIGAPYEISCGNRRDWMDALDIEIIVEKIEGLLERFPSKSKTKDLLRAPGATTELRTAAIEAGMRVADVDVVWNARLELPLWYREQAITETLHRYGNIVAKPDTLKR
jgi:RHH-type proline utilization regulon transcriptional repressor/proline dehydrogenase/delta 1-pyrroline-5-carboxylate dehydrogenase